MDQREPEVTSDKKKRIWLNEFMMLLKVWRFSWSLGLQLLIFGIAVALFAAVAFIIGHPYLLDGSLWGNDTYVAYMYQVWFAQWFPEIPFWWPYQGGNISYISGYPWGAYVIVVLVERLTALNLVQAFRLVGWASVPVTAIGIFAFCWLRLDRPKEKLTRQALGLIAGFFYILAPLAWIWLVQWGFYAESISHAFVAPTVIFADWYLTRTVKGQKGWLTRVLFLLGVLFWAGGSLTHFNVSLAVGMIVGTLGLLRILWSRQKGLLQRLWRLFAGLIALALVTFLLFSFRYVALNDYMGYVFKSGFGGYAPWTDEDILHNTLRPETMLGLETPPHEDLWEYVIYNMRFPIYVWILAVVGFVGGLVSSPVAVAFGLLTLIGFLTNTNLVVFKIISRLGILFGGGLTGRVVLIVMRLTAPILAAYGAAVVWEIFFSLFERVFKRARAFWLAWQPVRFVGVFVLAVLTAAWLFLKTYSVPYPAKWALHAGAFHDETIVPEHNFKFDLRDVWRRIPLENKDYLGAMLTDNSWYVERVGLEYLKELCQENEADWPICQHVVVQEGIAASLPEKSLIEDSLKECVGLFQKDFVGDYQWCQAFYLPLSWQLQPNNWPELTINDQLEGDLDPQSQEYFEVLPKDWSGRMDISGFSGRAIMIAPLFTEWSTIQAYTNNLPLIFNAQNYLARVMYTNFPAEQKPGVLGELGRWFGLEYALVTGGRNPEYWQQDQEWEQVEDSQWWHFPNPTGMVSWDKKPAILMVSDNSKFFYDQTFRLFNWGGLKYDQAMMIQGEKTVDSYSLKDLRQFEAVFMRGYDYRSRGGAYRLLDQYVKEGGVLVFDTGWQFHVPDWQLAKTPPFMPFEKLVWTETEAGAKINVTDPDLRKNLNLHAFGDLTWEKQGWAVSMAEGIRDWGRVVAETDGMPIAVIGEYGEGRVVWLGMNLLPHAEQFGSVEEMKFFNHLLAWALNDFTGNQAYQVSYQRDHPDQVNFSFDQNVVEGSWLFWREGWHPTWQAVLMQAGKEQILPVYRAGPGFMAMRLPDIQSGDSLLLRYKMSLKQKLFNILSLLSLLSLPLYLLGGWDWLIKRFRLQDLISKADWFNWLKKRLAKMKSSWDDMEN